MKRPLFISTIVVVFLTIFNVLAAQVIMPSKDHRNDIFLLNGKWKFKYISDTEQNKDSLFYTAGFVTSQWADIKVPGNWELQGFSTPTYGKNPKKGVGLYVTSFKVPENWKGNSYYIAFDGVQSGYDFWVNGHWGGSFASSFNRTTFDISKFLVPGEVNRLAVKVITHSKGYEFDTNDDWTLMGIIRNVTLFKLPLVHINDLVINSLINKSNATIEIGTTVEKSVKANFPKQLSLTGQLIDTGGKVVKTFTAAADQSSNNGNFIHYKSSFSIEKANLWSAETPYRYTLKINLRDNGQLLQEYTEKVGIREVTWSDGIFKLNGTPIKLKGVNHHDLSPVNGRSIDEKEMFQDLQLMRAANVNFIRTSHYPPCERFLELCDSLGIYMMDEVPFGYGDEHLNDTSYLPILKLRAKATVWRDKNHPCVLIWSVGNENPVTDICLKTGRYVKSLDHTRPYCFPQTPTVFKGMISAMPDSIEALDVHYPKLSELKAYATQFKQPLLLSEYSHALGLDFGTMEDYFEVIYTHSKVAGGAVWAFFDQGILRDAHKTISKDEPTLYVWPSKDKIYDTGENQGTDGVVYANRVPQVDYFQVRKVYSPVKALDDSLHYRPGNQSFQFHIVNRYDFTNLSNVKCKWQLFSDTVMVKSGQLPLICKPHDTVSAQINTTLPKDPGAHFYYVKLLFERKDGYQFYEKSYALNTNSSALLTLLNQRKASAPQKTGDQIIANDYQFSFSKDSGGIQVKNHSGKVVIANGMFARVGRKMTMTQEATTTSKRSKVLHTLWNPFILTNPTNEVKTFNSETLMLNCTYKPTTPENRSISGEISYHFSDHGHINVNYHLTASGKEEALETGISFLIPNSLTEFRWIGKGPYAAYPGKERLSEFGVYHLNSNDLYFPGNRQNVVCAVFSDAKGNGFALIAKNANIAVERTADGIIVSHNSYVASCFNKYEWPENLFSFDKQKNITGSFEIVPFNAQSWPAVFNTMFGEANKVVKAYQPFYHSYDQ